jgi:tripartite-type tricarboxylate transporter receptor subunit TctC
MPRLAKGQTYPSRPVHIIVGFAPGSAFDILARLIGQRLSEQLGQPFIVENRSGAAGSIATEAVARARPDGYTLPLSPVRPTQSMRRSTTISISSLSTTLRRSPASVARQT